MCVSTTWINKWVILIVATLKSWYEKRINIFLTTWNQLRVSLETNGKITNKPKPHDRVAQSHLSVFGNMDYTS